MSKKHLGKINKIIVAVLSIVFLLLIFGCEKVVSNKINIVENNVKYSKTTQSYVYDVVEEMVYKIAKIKYPKITKESDDVVKVVEQLEKIIVTSDIPEDKYKGFFERIEQNTTDIVSSLNKISNDTDDESTYDILLSSYNDIIDTFGFEKFTHIVYEVILMTLQNDIDNNKDRLKNNYEDTSLRIYYEGRVNDSINNKNAFLTIEKSQFEKLIRSIVIILNLNKITDEYSLDSIANTFSNEEIKVLINQVDFDISFTVDQWTILIKETSFISGVVGDFDSIVISNNHFEEVSNLLNKLFSLICNIQEELTVDSIEYLVSKDVEGLLGEIINNFASQDKVLLTEIVSTKLTGKDYLDWLSGDNSKLREIYYSSKKTVNEFIASEYGERENTLYGLIRGIFDDRT